MPALSDYQAIADALRLLREEIGHYDGMLITGINFRFREDDVLLVVKAQREGENLVCFTSAVTAIDALDLFYGHIRSRAYPQVSWRPDKYAR